MTRAKHSAPGTIRVQAYLWKTSENCQERLKAYAFARRITQLEVLEELINTLPTVQVEWSEPIGNGGCTR